MMQFNAISLRNCRTFSITLRMQKSKLNSRYVYRLIHTVSTMVFRFHILRQLSISILLDSAMQTMLPSLYTIHSMINVRRWGRANGLAYYQQSLRRKSTDYSIREPVYQFRKKAMRIGSNWMCSNWDIIFNVFRWTQRCAESKKCVEANNTYYFYESYVNW